MNSSRLKEKLQLGRNFTTPRSSACGRKCRRPALFLLAAMASANLSAFAGDPAPPAVPAVAPAAPPAAPAKPSGAKIQFETPTYDFGKISAGEVVNHIYYFTNTGTETLTLTSVAPSCGCTTAGDWSRSVEPGKTGTIPIRFNSTPGYSGPVGKSVTVKCNDPAQETVVLQIKGTLWQAIDVNPRYAMLNATTETPAAPMVVHIVNNTEQPLTLSPPESNNRSFTADLTTNQPGKSYDVTVKTVPPLAAGNVTGIITLKTSVTNMPTISITAYVNVSPVVTVSPPAIALPAGSLPQAMTNVVTIRNTSTNALELSEPAISAKGVDLQLKEVDKGRYFTATLTFPAGFEIAQGTQVELTLKSSNPQTPVIKVPVQQALRPTPPPAQRILPTAVPPAPTIPPAPK